MHFSETEKVHSLGEKVHSLREKVHSLQEKVHSEQQKVHSEEVMSLKKCTWYLHLCTLKHLRTKSAHKVHNKKCTFF